MTAKGCTHIAGIRTRHAERAWLRGMPEERQQMAAFADLPLLRPCRMLRRFPQQARDRAFSTPPVTPSSRATIRRRAGAGVTSTRVLFDLSNRKTPHTRPDPALLLIQSARGREL